MPRNFNLRALGAKLPKLSPGTPRDAKTMLRAVLGTLLAANLIAAFFVVRPPGGSPQDLEQQLRSLQSQIQQRRTSLGMIRAVSSKVDKGRAEGASFMK